MMVVTVNPKESAWITWFIQTSGKIKNVQNQNAYSWWENTMDKEWSFIVTWAYQYAGINSQNCVWHMKKTINIQKMSNWILGDYSVSFVIINLFFFLLLFICAYKAWFISPPCPHPLVIINLNRCVTQVGMFKVGKAVTMCESRYMSTVYLLLNFAVKPKSL
jgi:hypothetical protein